MVHLPVLPEQLSNSDSRVECGQPSKILPRRGFCSLPLLLLVNYAVHICDFSKGPGFRWELILIVLTFRIRLCS